MRVVHPRYERVEFETLFVSIQKQQETIADRFYVTSQIIADQLTPGASSQQAALLLVQPCRLIPGLLHVLYTSFLLVAVLLTYLEFRV